jgi:hypothetical protein
MSATAYGLLVWIVFVALLAFLVWVYLSILHVRRRALRIQAVLYLLIYAWNAPGKWQELEFAFEHLDIRFAVLATFGTVMVFLVFPLALVVTLWVVSRARRHRASRRRSTAARARPLTYCNKLLDLPRTPRTLPPRRPMSLRFPARSC